MWATLATWVSSWGGATSQFVSTLLNDWIVTDELTCLASHKKRIPCMGLMVTFPLEIKCQGGLHLYADGEVGSPSLVSWSSTAPLLTSGCIRVHACLFLWGWLRKSAYVSWCRHHEELRFNPACRTSDVRLLRIKSRSQLCDPEKVIWFFSTACFLLSKMREVLFISLGSWHNMYQVFSYHTNQLPWSICTVFLRTVSF